MGQKVTLTGTPVTGLRLVRSMMKPDKTATKVYSFDMHEKASSSPAKSLPNGSTILFTVFANEKQLNKAGINSINIKQTRIMVQGDLVMDVSTSDCPGELGVTANQIQVIVPKEKQEETTQNNETSSQ